jgi:hypothetical protein
VVELDFIGVDVVELELEKGKVARAKRYFTSSLINFGVLGIILML